MIQFPQQAVLPPGGMIEVANQAVAYWQIYGVLPDYELAETDPAVPNLLKYTAWSGGNVELSNSGDELLVLDAFDQPADAIS